MLADRSLQFRLCNLNLLAPGPLFRYAQTGFPVRWKGAAEMTGSPPFQRDLQKPDQSPPY